MGWTSGEVERDPEGGLWTGLEYWELRAPCMVSRLGWVGDGQEPHGLPVVS